MADSTEPGMQQTGLVGLTSGNVVKQVADTHLP